MNASDLSRRISDKEYQYVKEVLDNEFRSSKGSIMMSRFEKAFCEKIGAKYGISQINGTTTMHSILEAVGIGPGDEVIVPPLTMSSTTFVVLQANATPVFADIDPDTFQIDPKSIEQRITKKTKAIITVALYGLSPDMDPIMALAAKHDLLVIEDNAECLLGKYKGKMVGTLGHVASFSFQSSKHVTAGEGGIVSTDDLDLAQKVRKVSSLGYAGVDATKGKISKKDIQDPNYSRHVSMGWNYRMPELCAAVLLGQIENVDALVERRIDVAHLFQESTKDCSWIIPQYVGPEYINSYWTWVVKMENPRITWYQFRDKFLEFGGNGIYAAWKLTYLEPMFQNMELLGRDKFISSENKQKYVAGNCPKAESIHGKLLQFKTNYWRWEDAERQAEVLKKTIRSF